MEITMFLTLLLFMIGSACIICMPIAHSASYHAYEKSKDAEAKKNSNDTTVFLGSAAWFQALCYFLGVLGSMSFVWCGVELASKIQ